MAVEDQQAVVDTVEHRLQALLLGQQLLDIARLEHAQGLGHQPEAADQRGDLVHRRQRQGDLEVPLADLIGRLGQSIYGLAEAPGNALGGDEADQQYRPAEYAEHAGDQQRAVAGRSFGGRDHRQGVALQLHYATAQDVQGAPEFIVVQQAPAQAGGLAHDVEEVMVGRGDPLEMLAGLGVVVRVQSVLQGVEEATLRLLQRRHVQLLAHQVDHLVAQVLAQAQADVDGREGAIDQAFLGAGHLRDADQPQQQAEQGHRDQRGNAQEQPSVQSHAGAPLHRP
ncbi:hypothetical protein D3C81_1331960 [compost metagenome]